MPADLPLVGRRSELALLASALAPGREPRAVVLVGEAGVGKTRLVTEAIRTAGVRVLSGGCLPLSETVPFLPIAEALRGLDEGVVARSSEQVREAVTQLMAGGPPGPLFAGLRDLFAEAGPVALAIEDVHWADASTLDFLVYLGAVGRTPLVLTCREEEIGTRLLELERRPGVARVHLTRLTLDETSQHMGAMLGGPVPTAYVGEVFDRAEGNAFFTEQLVLAGRGSGLPEGMANLLIARADKVDADSRTVLEALAVAAGPLDESLLAAVTGLAGTMLTEALRRLTRARLIDPPSADGRYRLRHALVGEALMTAMTDGERRSGHARLARELSAAGADGRAGEIAEHWRVAGQHEHEAAWRLTAAREAERMTAYREAARHWVRLIELEPHPDRYFAALEALDRCGDSQSARPLAERAVDTFAAELDRPRLALLYERVGCYRWLDDVRAALEPMETALALLGGLPRRREFVVVAQAYAAVLYDLGRSGESRPLLEQALKVCQAENLPVESIKVLRDLGTQLHHEGDVASGERLLAEAAAIAERYDDALTIASLAFQRAESKLVLGRLAEAAEDALRGFEAARRAGLERQANTEFLAYCHFEALMELGRAADAERILPPGTEAGTISCVALARAYLETLAGDQMAASARLAEIDAAVSPVSLSDGAWVSPRSEVDLWLGRPEKALNRIRQLPDGLDPGQLWGSTGPILRVAARACADLAENARLRGDTDGVARAQDWAAELVAAHADMDPDPFAKHPFWSFAPGEGASWRAELARVAGEADPDAWEAAAAEWERQGRPHRVAYARWRQGEALLATGQRAQAGSTLREAAAAAENHAPIRDGIRDTLRLARLTLPERSTPTPYGLTAREKAVLALVAEGLTNVQIGRRLYISDSTVSVHLTNLMRKLGVSNRAQAAALGQRAGLLSQD
jgi:DNA-binding CsgD family transcriptional regulator/tetratricopeptide (TPR) repeat protein